MEPFIGQIMLFAGNFAPRGWALCDGQLLPIAQNSALFSILGTTYGGDGKTTFALPDLRGRIPMHAGQGPGLSPRRLGERAGAETTTLTTNNLPAHNHALLASSSAPDDDSAAGNALAQSEIYVGGAATNSMGQSSIGPTGEGQPVQNVQPFLCVNAIIALEGIFPSRS
ncbi:MAG: tail fiber protein [Myxococcales bacterium]|nr:tail fiber protein [Myxococcales bacterium]